MLSPLTAFLQGIVVGFLIAVPVGPVGVLCIRRALVDGRLAAFVAGLGAAVADTFFGAVAGLGLTLISGFLLDHRLALSLIGGGFLAVMGWRSWRAEVAGEDNRSRTHLGLLRDFTMSLLVTLTNPATILAFMAVFASLGAMQLGHDLPRAGLMIGGVFLGSSLWWFTLSALSALVRQQFSQQWMQRLNRVSGGLLMVSGVAIAISAFFTG